MSIYYLIEYSNSYLKTGCLWECHRDESVLDNNGAIADFLAAKITLLHLNLKQRQQLEQAMMAQKMLR